VCCHTIAIIAAEHPPFQQAIELVMPDGACFCIRSVSRSYDGG
jgi:hypothetical protein